MGTAQAMAVNFNGERISLTRMSRRKRLAYLGEGIVHSVDKAVADETENRMPGEEKAYNIMVPVCRAETTPASDGESFTDNFDAEVDRTVVDDLIEIRRVIVYQLAMDCR